MQKNTQFNPPGRFSATARAAALALGLMAAAPLAWSQSNTTTTIYGEVKAAAGASIVLQNLSTGVLRTLTPDSAGRYQANSMPPGRYQVRLVRDGKVESTQEVEALVGGGVEANFGAANTLATVVVSGAAKRIDVSNTNNGVVFAAQELKALPVANDVLAVVQLTPGVTRNTNGQYGNAPQIGGSGASENAYYVNGFPVTNILTGVGMSELPFGAIGNMQVLTGGYGAEFGRSTGGVVNITTKSGGNNWEVGGKLSLSPNSLRGTPDNTYYPNTGANPLTDGKLQYWNQDNISTTKVYGLYAGGPILKNKLFAFVAAEQTRTDSESVSASPTATASQLKNGYSVGDSKVEHYLLKLDYNLTDDHHFELTKMYDRTTSRSQGFGYDFGTHSSNGIAGGAGNTYVNNCPNNSYCVPGANLTIAKYTGYLTDQLTVTALYGDSRTKHARTPWNYDPRFAQTSSSVDARAPGLTYNDPQTTTGLLVAPDSGDRQKGGRLDIEYQWGKHSLRAGLDHMSISSVVGIDLAGGSRWSYQHASSPNFKPFGATETLAQGGGLGTLGYYVSQDFNSKIARPTSVQSAQYIQDRWQVTPTVLLDLGLRREQFTNNDSFDRELISQRNMIAPRLAATWDLNGDGGTKLFANLGRYHLPVPSSLSSNMATGALNTSTYYTYTGVDPITGTPTGLHAISKATSVNNAFGQTPDPRSLVGIDLKPFSQDEFALGFERSLSKTINIGASLLYRKLNDTLDDSCDQRPIDAWAVRNKVDAQHYDGFACAILNPGRDNSLMVDFGDGKGLRRVDISAAEWGTPRPNRSYKALNFFAEHPFSNGWYGKLTYTLSASKGNQEGQTDSVGGGDVGLTVSDDHKELMENSYGYLGNDHRHAIKAYGYVQVLPEVFIGGNLQMVSGAPRNCTGLHPDQDVRDLGYGASYFYCNGKPSPRGSAGRLPWYTQVDLNFAYRPAFVKGLSLKADVFNVLDKRGTTRMSDTRETTSGSISSTYGQITGRQSPRSVRLTAEYNLAF
ncbi:TonB-dependent receptor [Pelomonas sp. V22]|uniref:TonB-dependent receptor n=1 Tax=Pelomonas sp. V22 TaxID=2822139 RepID=UPI0024A97E95|nr:TonB-dependent receptor [Pelomonas sp. V22]MDI4632646.1 TonB-dependent receptor [Pelomonas sp. V22]